MRIVILSSIISPLPSARWRSSHNVCDARRKAQCWYLQDYRRRCISLVRVASSRHIYMSLSRLTEVEGEMILVFGRVVTKCP